MKRKSPVMLLFTCSGAADVGELTDRAARKMRDEGIAAMSCLASVGAQDADILFNAQLAERVLLIDGCPKACARRAFAHAGISRYLHFDLSQIGLFKGRSPATLCNIGTVVAHATKVLEAHSAPQSTFCRSS